MKKSRSSNFAPIFIGSTVVFFLGSAFKFVFNKENASKKEVNQSQVLDSSDDALEEKESNAQEPEEDPVQSL